MAVGFRSFLNVETAPCIDTVIDHLDRWSRAKEIRVDAGAPGRYLLDPDDIVTVDRHEADGRAVYRWRRLHPHAQGRNEIWRTSVTAVDAQDGRSWLWTEIEAADDDEDEPARVPFMSVPAVLRAMLADLRCRDGIVPSGTEPSWVTSDALPDLMDYLADEGRLGPVYVARQGARAPEAFHAWATQVMWEVVGLGNAFLLGGAVEQEFNEMVCELHAIPDGAIRTYLPGVRLDDPRDPRRHQILGSVRIDRSGPRRLAYIFGLSQRDRGGLAPLPPDVADVERLLAGEAERYGAGLHVVADVPAGEGDRLAEASSGRAALSRRAQHRRLVELLEENEQLRAEVDRLRSALGVSHHSGTALLTALETLEEEVRTLRRRHGGLEGLLATEPQLTAS